MIKTPVEVFGVCAAAALYRSKALKEVGLFDKSFFTILEDVDLSWRIRLSGYKALLVPTAKVFHKRGISGRKQNSKRLAMLKTYYGSKNRVCLVLKYYPTGLILKFFALLCCRFFRASTCSMGIKDNLITDVFRCLKQRKTIHHKYPNIKEIQDKWIRRSPIGI
ncbi:MAG: hypothetical protein QMD66_01395 [Actinomycetota bacterium]|nr:hypothetical protein [Actinomycetota bacterium]